MSAVTTRDHNPRYFDGPPEGGHYAGGLTVRLKADTTQAASRSA